MTLLLANQIADIFRARLEGSDTIQPLKYLKDKD